MGKSLIIKGADFSQNTVPVASVLQEYGLFDGMFMKYGGTVISALEDVSQKSNGCFCSTSNFTLNGAGSQANLSYVVVSKGIDIQNALTVKITTDTKLLSWGFLNDYNFAHAFPTCAFYNSSGTRIIGYMPHTIKSGATQEQLEAIEQALIDNNYVWIETNIKELILDVPENAKYFKIQQSDIQLNQNFKIQLIGFPD